MDFIKQLLADSLNGFSLKFLPFFLVQIFTAALLGLLFAKVWKYKFKSIFSENATIIAGSMAILTSIVKYSMPGAVILAALILLLVKKDEYKKLDLIALTIVMGIGVGCGLGSVFQIFIGVLTLICMLIFIPFQPNEKAD